MNLGEMRSEVSVIVYDLHFDADTIDRYINDAVKYAADQVSIPSLKRLGSVETVVDQAYTSIASINGNSFNGIVRRLVGGNGQNITVDANLEELMERYPELDSTGQVNYAAVEGNILWYQSIPSSAETLSVVYYKNPESLTGDADIPSDFPDHLHRRLFVNGAAWLIWDAKEQDEEGRKPNTVNQFYQSFNESSKESGITKLREWIGKRRVHHISSTWSV